MQALIDDPCVSNWLKTAVKSLVERDPVDAIKDAELLHHLMNLRLNEAFSNAEHGTVCYGK